MDNIITFASVTSAMKAKELLRTRQIGARMISTPEKLRHGSCGYSLVIPKHFDEAAELIRGSRIPYRGIFAGDAV